MRADKSTGRYMIISGYMIISKKPTNKTLVNTILLTRFIAADLHVKVFLLELCFTLLLW